MLRHDVRGLRPLRGVVPPGDDSPRDTDRAQPLRRRNPRPQASEPAATDPRDQKMDIENKRKDFEVKLDTVLGNQGSDYLKPEVHFLEGDADETIPRLAIEKKVDLVIMGTISRTGLPGFMMGNTAESILNQLACSVLAIKPEGFVSPVTL